MAVDKRMRTASGSARITSQKALYILSTAAYLMVIQYPLGHRDKGFPFLAVIKSHTESRAVSPAMIIDPALSGQTRGSHPYPHVCSFPPTGFISRAIDPMAPPWVIVLFEFLSWTPIVGPSGHRTAPTSYISVIRFACVNRGWQQFR